MEIMTWSDPRYFVFANALIRSIRYHENENNIITYLLDFSDDQFNEVQNMFKNDSKLTFKRLFSNKTKEYTVIDNSSNNPDVENGKTQFYRNFRPRIFLEELKISKSGKLCTFGANGLVFTNLKYIDEILDNKDFVFLEREKRNIFSKIPTTVTCIEDIVSLVKDQNIDINKILPETTGKVVLLGTHAMRNTHAVNSIIGRWVELIENTDSINKKFSDMNLFVKAYVENILSNQNIATKETGINIPRKNHPFCDTSLIPGNKIWFAKGPAKFSNKRYLEEVQKFSKFNYKV